jgi:hypothetical protein
MVRILRFNEMYEYEDFTMSDMEIVKEQMNHKSYLRAVSDPRDIGTALAQ